jgi:branched-chain amino acid transport system substrate-binding protein
VTRGYKYTFKITPQGGAVWNWSMSSGYDMWKAAKGSPPKSALIFMSNDAVGLVVQKQLPEHAKTLSLDVPFSQSFQMGLSDPSVAVAPVLRYKPEMIFLGGFVNDIILIIKALRGVGITAPIFGAGPAGSDSVGQGLGAAADRFFAPMAWNWDLNMPGNKEFVEAYHKAYPSAPYPPANEQLGQGYVCGMIIRQALEKAASRDPRKIRDVLATAEFTNLPYPNPTVKFGPDGLNVNNKEVLAEWIKSELRTVWPKDVQTVSPLL